MLVRENQTQTESNNKKKVGEKGEERESEGTQGREGGPRKGGREEWREEGGRKGGREKRMYACMHVYTAQLKYFMGYKFRRF